MRAEDFDYHLPRELIAQTPAPARDQSRLLVLHRASHRIEHRGFAELTDYLLEGDVLVLNNSKVLPACLRGTKATTGGAIEILLCEEIAWNDWWAIVQPGKRVRLGTEINLLDHTGRPGAIRALLTEKHVEGRCRLRFSGTINIANELHVLGKMPLPPYIHRPRHATSELDWLRYQTVYAQAPGSIAAPTAGLHFTEALLRRMRERGVEVQEITLHVGLGTFAPVRVATLTDHVMHSECFELGSEVAGVINAAKSNGRRVFAVGTTTVRVLEAVAAMNAGKLVGTTGQTRIFIYPPYTFRIVDALVTNFHLPRSTLLMLVSAFAADGETSGRDLVMHTYAEAIARRYRFYSYGDAMVVL